MGTAQQAVLTGLVHGWKVGSSESQDKELQNLLCALLIWFSVVNWGQVAFL